LVFLSLLIMDASLNDVLPVRGSSERLLFVVGVLAAGSIAYFLSLVTYRLFFHPLAKFPGPRINAVSDVRTLSLEFAVT